MSFPKTQCRWRGSVRQVLSRRSGGESLHIGVTWCVLGELAELIDVVSLSKTPSDR